MADVSVALTGVVATGELNFANPITTYEGVLFGMSAFGEAGSSPAIYVDQNAVTGQANVAVTGVLANGLLGIEDVTADANTTATKVSATAQVGGVDVPIYVTGVSATTYVNINLFPMSEGTLLGFSAFDELNTQTSYVRPLVVTADATTITNNTGVLATGQVGTVSVRAEANVTLLGVSAESQTGLVDIPVNVAGVSGTSTLESVVIAADSNVYPLNVFATGAIGSVNISADANVDTTSVSAEVQVGGVDVPTYVTGVSCSGTVGSVSIAADANVIPLGVFATGQVKSVRLWSNVDNAVATNWVDIAA